MSTKHSSNEQKHSSNEPINSWPTIDIIGHVTAALSSLAHPSCSARPLEPDLAAALGPERKFQKNSSNEQKICSNEQKNSSNKQKKSSNEQKYLVQIYI